MHDSRNDSLQIHALTVAIADLASTIPVTGHVEADARVERVQSLLEVLHRYTAGAALTAEVSAARHLAAVQ